MLLNYDIVHKISLLAHKLQQIFKNIKKYVNGIESTNNIFYNRNIIRIEYKLMSILF